MAKFQCNVISYSLKRTVDITVIVPTPTIPQSMGMGMKEGETPHHTPKAPYPVLYLLHGVGNNHAQWTGYTKAELYAEEHQIIIVNVSGENGFYITNEGGDDYFRFISEELPDFVTGIFPASTRVEDTYLAGLSMGGYGTFVHALTFPERFHAVGLFSAAIGERAETSHPYWADRYKPSWIIEHLKETAYPKFYMACGAKDVHWFKSGKAYAEKLREHGIDVTWDEMEEYGHEWRFWDIQLEKFLKWLPRTDIYAADGPRQI